MSFSVFLDRSQTSVVILDPPEQHRVRVAPELQGVAASS
jgi:hypothetical protein